ncbi:hypothetical protein [Kribbella swartbergensis]
MSRRPFPLLKELPRELHDVILDFHWDQRLLWALDLPVLELEVAGLVWHLELPFWSQDGRPFQVSPLEVAADPAMHPEQHARTMRADLSYPLDAVRRSDGRITILDGVHRLLRAHVDGLRSVRVRVLPWEQLDAIAVRR